MTIHWCGTGFSSGPGLRRLIAADLPVTVWNRTLSHAAGLVGDMDADIRNFTLGAVTETLEPGDIVVSMLPADHHVSIARACLAKGAHFVCSSITSPEMRALDKSFLDEGLVSQNAIGFSPGLDHLMAHDLVERYRASRIYSPDNILSFSSYCGGVPRIPNAFRYKFNWAPVAVLESLREPSCFIRDFVETSVHYPWEAIETYNAPLPKPENFEVCPTRDSRPFLIEYGFEPDWKVREFVRGTLRLEGWAEAWKPVFGILKGLEGQRSTEMESRLDSLAEELLAANSYAPGERDRAVILVTLKVERDKRVLSHETWALDASGNGQGTAMARLVSIPVSWAVEAILRGEIPPGVHIASRDPRLIARWLRETQKIAQYLERVDHLI